MKSNSLPNILGMDQAGLAEALAKLKEPKFRSRQLWEWLHQKRADSFSDMSNLSKSLRQKLEKTYSVRSFEINDHLVSSDGLTEKWLFDSGSGLIETVLIREKHLSRRTLCVSCMVGCPLDCAFCSTGQVGFERDLSRAEILEQVYVADQSCRESEKLDSDRAITNVVFMGMGEPLLNYEEVIAAAKTLAAPEAMNLSGRHITISTVGVTSGILRLAEENLNFRLALSLHAPDQQLRERLIPSAKKWKLPAIIAAVKTFAKQSSRDVTIEYCLINNVNDSKKHARELADLLKGISCKVNLIPLNPSPGFAASPPPRDRVTAFKDSLERQGIAATIRVEKGNDIDAACGQLRSKHKHNSETEDIQ